MRTKKVTPGATPRKPGRPAKDTVKKQLKLRPSVIAALAARSETERRTQSELADSILSLALDVR